MPARASILDCRQADNSKAPRLSLTECRRQWHAAQSRWVARGVGPFCYRMGFSGCLLYAVYVCFAIGWIVLVVMLLGGVFGETPFLLNGRAVGRMKSLEFTAFMLVAWSGLACLFIPAARRGLRVLRGVAPPPSLGTLPPLECTFEYHTNEGIAFESRERVAMPDRLGDGPDEPVLYDHERPEWATLPAGLWPPIRPSATGAWEADGPGALRRTALAALCCLGSPLAITVYLALFGP